MAVNIFVKAQVPKSLISHIAAFIQSLGSSSLQKGVGEEVASAR
jgi:hypothetical protein